MRENIINEVKEMITEQELKELIELNEKIKKACDEFHGQLDDLYAAIGLIAMGRHYGWRVMRLIAHRRHWAVAKQIFGDPKALMPERGRLYGKSLGCKIVDEASGYWDFIRGNKSIDLQSRRASLP
jgi:hypothetical protein